MTATAVVRRPRTSPGARASGLSAAITRRWVAIYTRGVSSEAAYRRRTEVECDLWEQQEEADAAGNKQSLRLAMNVLGRLLRGLPADIAWRSRMEGSLVSINIPANRGVGILFFLTMILLVVATSIPGYDTGATDWENTMRHLSEKSTTETSVIIAFQVLSGIAIIGTAGLFAHLLRPHSPLLASVSGYGLAAAGILTLGTSAMYAVMIEFSRQWAVDPGANASVGHMARAFGVGMDHFGAASALALILSVGAMAVATGRARLVPAWAIWLPVIGVPVFLAGALVSVGDAGDMFVWIATSIGLVTALAWLVVSGIALVARSVATPPAASAPASP